MSMVLLITIIQATVIILLVIFMAKFRIWKPKRTVYLVLVYIACGVVAFVYLAVASQNIEKVESMAFLEAQQAKNEEITERLEMRDFSVLNEEDVKFTVKFTPTTEDVYINREQELRYIHTYINWVDTADHEITASYYEMPTYLNRVDTTPYVKQPSITFSNNTIYIEDENTKVTMKSIDMSVTMLSNAVNEYRSSDLANRLIGNRILYLNVPKHFNIIDSSGWN
ncbi:O-antigen ligase family protein [Solibacillus sp. MA9]|uniref:O-antigen ligase family protein n=1 Tax=Solibacillus palustris TaxID=2908203 RepID=A0ABS9UHI3_9BACL|nr:O-antigen ligase family protein [Solibacillus sp. MA9]MCH7323792.1 O-antigen ligase family protein [Solibacillus sp. MA9]